MDKCCGASTVGSGRSTGTLSSVSRAIWKSLRFAPSATTPKGTPRPSVSRLRFTPLLARSVGLGPVFPPTQGGLGHRPIQRLPRPLDPFQGVVFFQAQRPQLLKHAGFGPLLEAAMGGTAGADAGGVQRVPLAAGAQP